MTLDGAIKFGEGNNYTIYTMNSATTGQYCVVLPNGVNNSLDMLVDLHKKVDFDAVSSGSKSKEELVADISKEYDLLNAKYVERILVIPMIDENSFKMAVNNNDKQKMFDETKKIGAITSEIYKKLTDSGIDGQKINQKIIMVEKNDDDVKFVEWLKTQMPNFVDGFLYNEVEKKEETVNPFMNVNPFGESVANPVVEQQTNSIFDNVASNDSVSSNDNVAVAQTVEPVSVPNDIFGNDNSVNVVPEVEPVVSNDIFGSSNVAPAVETPQPEVNVTEPVNVEPQPVANTQLEGTTTFSPIADANVTSEVNNTAPQVEGEVGGTDRKSSKGFANLLILLVILVGVTVVSIELGKFLYSVYGA